ncbi:MAG: hypothetical protein AB7I18_02195 [Candidatus Berkiella sp.]
MENGPRLQPDFDNLSFRELYTVFIKAVENRDSECIAECIKRDGFNLNPCHFETVAMHFAYKNDLAACEYLERFKGCMPHEFICGALLGGHTDLIKYYLKKHDLRYSIGLCLDYAKMINKTEQLQKCWYRDQLVSFFEIELSIPDFGSLSLMYKARYTDESSDDLVKKYPDSAVLVYVIRNEEKNLLDYLAQKNSIREWNQALIISLTLANSTIESLILPHIVKINARHVSAAMVNGDIKKLKLYFNQCTLSDEEIIEMLNHAAPEDFRSSEFLIEKLRDNQREHYAKACVRARSAGFFYVANYLYNRMLACQLPKQSDLVKKTSANVPPKATIVEVKTEETPTSKLEELIQIQTDSIFELEKRGDYEKDFGEVKINSNNLNMLLDRMLFILEQNQIITLNRIKDHVFISENEPAYKILKDLLLNHNWLNRSNFVTSNAKLVTSSKSTRVPLKKFYEFYDEFNEKLKQLKNHQSLQVPSLLVPTEANNNAQVIQAERAQAVEPTKMTETVDTVQKTKTINTSAKSGVRESYHNSNLSSSYTPTFNKKTKKGAKNVKPNRVGTSQLSTVKPKVRQEQHKVKASVQQQAPLPAQDKVNFLPVRDIDYTSMLRNENMPFAKQQKSSQQSAYFDPLSELMQHYKETQRALNNVTDGVLVHDLAIIDLLFKINRDLNDDKFSTMFIHGIHHYIMKRSSQHSNAVSFVNECFQFGSKEVLSTFSRDFHVFIRYIRDMGNTETSPSARLDLIRELFKLQPICYQLCQSQDANIQRVGRHALSGIMMMIGEQVQQLKDTEIDKNLAQLPVYKVLNEYRLYRNVRHGTEYLKQVKDITLHMERDDWEKQLDTMLARFTEYYSQSFVDMLNLCEIESKLSKMHL